MKTLKLITKAEFNKLDAHAKRVLIAQDVLDRLEAKKIIETRGTYFDLWDKDLDAKSLINSRTCHICALGATVCSFVGKFNNRTVGQLAMADPEVVEIFGKKLWSTIEHIFEGWHQEYGVTQEERAPKWSMKQIMENIVRNKGKLKIVFKKSKEYGKQRTYIVG